MPRRSDKITLSPKHGVNPTIPKCFLCQEDKNEVLLLGRLPKDAEAPRGMAWDKEPCDKCQEWMTKGVILISVRDEEETENPYRTGGWVVLKDGAIIDRIHPKELAEELLRKRVGFVPDDAWSALGLPTNHIGPTTKERGNNEQ